MIGRRSHKKVQGFRGGRESCGMLGEMGREEGRAYSCIIIEIQTTGC